MGAVYGRSLRAQFTGAVYGRRLRAQLWAHLRGAFHGHGTLAVETISFSRLHPTDRESPRATLSHVLQCGVNTYDSSQVLFWSVCPGCSWHCVAAGLCVVCDCCCTQSLLRTGVWSQRSCIECTAQQAPSKPIPAVFRAGNLVLGVLATELPRPCLNSCRKLGVPGSWQGPPGTTK